MSETLMTYSQLSQEASHAAENYLKRAIESVEDVMGLGAAAKYPAIVAAVVAAAASDYAASMLSHRVAPALADVAEALGWISEAMPSSDTD
jgi:hypothetical protein